MPFAHALDHTQGAGDRKQLRGVQAAACLCAAQGIAHVGDSAEGRSAEATDQNMGVLGLCQKAFDLVDIDLRLDLQRELASFFYRGLFRKHM